MHTGMIFIDLKKVYDIDHKPLLEMMTWVGFETLVIKWFEPYLSSGKFFIFRGLWWSHPCLIDIYLRYSPIIWKKLLPYADDMFHQENNKIEDVLFKSPQYCRWFIDRKLSINFGGIKRKCILFSEINKHS